jgi:hypothetical protein
MPTPPSPHSPRALASRALASRALASRLAAPALATLLALLATAATGQDAAPAARDERAAAPQVTVDRVVVTPPTPGPDTLCELRVTLRNQGKQPASELLFAVEVNDAELPVYRRHLFMQRLDPGASTEVRLFNFWSSETARPAPADGRYRVEVALLEARWYDITQQGEDEVWTPTGTVAGLPSRADVTVGKK